MNKTKDYTLVAIAVSNIVGCNCQGGMARMQLQKKKHQDGGVTSADGGSAGAAAQPHHHRTNNLSDDSCDAINLHFLLCLPILD